MKPSTWAGIAIGGSLVYFLDDKRGVARRKHAITQVVGLGRSLVDLRYTLSRRRRLDALDLIVDRELAREETSYEWPLSVVTIDVDDRA